MDLRKKSPACIQAGLMIGRIICVRKGGRQK